MALTTTTLAGTITAGQKMVKLTAFTNPVTGFGQQAMLKFATGEIRLITDASLSPTLETVPGYAGTLAEAHTVNEGVTYGLVSDPAWPNWPQKLRPATDAPTLKINAQEVTITGATGTDAAVVTIPAPGYLNLAGTSGAGVNLPVPAAGDWYGFRNNTTGVAKLYCIGGTINGTTGTTAVSVSATGSLGGILQCATAGAWYIAPMPT